MLTILKNNISPQLQDNYNYLVDRRCPLLGPVHAFGKGRIRRRPSAAQGRRLLRTFPFGPFVPGRNGEGSNCNLDRNKTATDRGRGGGSIFCVFWFFAPPPTQIQRERGRLFSCSALSEGVGRKMNCQQEVFRLQAQRKLIFDRTVKTFKGLSIMKYGNTKWWR